MPRFCTNCGKPLQFANAEICPQCGIQLKPPAQRERDGYAELLYNDPDINRLAEKVWGVFHKEGYELIEGTRTKGMYGTGSFGLRIIAGGFANYNKYSVEIAGAGPWTKLTFKTAMTGISGGFLGVHRLNKEFDRIKELLRVL